MKRLKVIACEVAFRELCFCASQSSTIIDFTFMPRKLHIVGAKNMQNILQSEIDKVEVEKYHAILLAYGLCGNGVVGLQSKLPIVIPKARNCISIFLGSKQRYEEISKKHPKAFYLTPGWLEREIVPNKGDILENLSQFKTMINEIVFVNTGVGSMDAYKTKLLENVDNAKWKFCDIEGDNSLLFRFINGEWSKDDFAIIPPNHQIVGLVDKEIIGYLSK